MAGLYAVTPDEPDTVRLARGTQAAIEGGARLLQYRNKTADPSLKLAQVRALLPICRAGGVPLIVNDDLELALATGAEGLHLGGEDGDLGAARARLGADRLLGASCYRDVGRALAAAASGADYVAFGSFYPSTTKPGAVAAPLGLIAEAKRAVRLPVVAIGGITVENAPHLIDAGVDAVAVISALFGAADVRGTARRFSALFESEKR